jgi:hypothetical protein
MFMHLWRVLDEENKPFCVIPGKAAGRAAIQCPTPGFRLPPE